MRQTHTFGPPNRPLRARWAATRRLVGDMARRCEPGEPVYALGVAIEFLDALLSSAGSGRPLPELRRARDQLIQAGLKRLPPAYR